MIVDIRYEIDDDRRLVYFHGDDCWRGGGISVHKHLDRLAVAIHFGFFERLLYRRGTQEWLTQKNAGHRDDLVAARLAALLIARDELLDRGLIREEATA